MPTAFLTGISGQDGYYLSRHILATGMQVHGFVRPGDDQDLHPAVLRHEGDLADGERLARLVADLAPDVVVNLGGVTSVAASWAKPVETAQVTGAAVARLLEACWQLQSAGRPVRFLQASSSEIFGDDAPVPQDERTPVHPVSPYGAAKAYAHQLCGIYRRRGLFASTVILYGHESPRRPHGFAARRISAGVAAITRGEAAELRLGNLAAARDWGWAPDFVDAMSLVLRHHEPADFIVSTGQAHTVEEFVTEAFAVAGIDDWRRYVRIDPALLRPHDGAVQIGDASRLRALGWAPSKTFAEVVDALVRAELAGSGVAGDPTGANA